MYKRILVPVDGSATSLKALACAITLAKESAGQIRIIHVLEQLTYLTYDPYGGYTTELMQAIRDSSVKLLHEAEALAHAASVTVDSQTLDEIGIPLGEVVAQNADSWNADLIVLGTHGRGGVRRFLMGSGAEQVIRLAPVPVLVIRADESIPIAAIQ